MSTNVNRAQGQNCLVTRSRVNVRVLTHDLNVHIHMVCIITDAMYSEMCGVLTLILITRLSQTLSLFIYSLLHYIGLLTHTSMTDLTVTCANRDHYAIAFTHLG